LVVVARGTRDGRRGSSGGRRSTRELAMATARSASSSEATMRAKEGREGA
jgi:hypothetical protein